MDAIQNIIKSILPEDVTPGEGIVELVKLFIDMKIPEETIIRMMECLKGQTPDEMDKTAASLIRHFKKPGAREA